MGSFPWETLFLHMSAWECGWSAVIAWSAIVFVGVLTLKTLAARTRNGKNTKRLAPGPRGIPLLGYLPFIWKPYHVVFHELSKRYGPIVRVRLGDKDVVVLHDLKSIREALTNPDVLYRPRDFLFNYLGVEGIAVMNGQPWQTNRRYCFHVLRNLGFAKKSMEEHIHEELQCFTDLLSSSKGKPMLVAQPLVSSVANNISALVFGRRYGLDDAKGRHVVGQLSKFLRYGNFFSVLDFLPVVRLLAFYIPYTSLRVMRSISKELTKVVREEIKQREENTDDKLEADFIDGYMRKIKENEGTDSHYNLKYLEGNALNFYGPATNPVRTIILWLVYLVASDPDGVQASIQQEIDSVIGRQRAPEWNDRNKMPFTMASILETLRWRTTAPLSLHRAAGRDTTIGGYDIPAGTLVVPNLSTLHNDPEHWPNPSQFDATRFLNADGTEVDEKSLAYMPFSIGRRACPGETLALMEIFLYVTTMLQKFRVLPEEGKTISLEIQRALLDVVDETQGLRFIPR